MKFAKDLAEAEGAVLTAVGSRSMERAQQFAKEFNIPRTYGSYEELLRDPDVEIVYVGTLHPMHKDHVLSCLNAGKAVICEKPFTINASEAEEIVRVAREKRLFVMEAMWTRFLPPIVKVREWLREGVIGEVRLVKADFGFGIGWQPEGRLLNKELGGGALLDAGIYPISFASNDAYLFGTKGYIHIPNFLFGQSASLHVNGEEPVHFIDDRKSIGYKFEAEAAMECLREGRLESDVMPLDETIQIMKTMDTVRRQWNLKYPTEL